MLFASRGGGGGGWSGGKGKGGVGLMHVDSSGIFSFLFSSILFVVVFLFFSNQSTTVSVAAPCGTSCDENVFLEQLQQSGVCHFRR